MTKLTYNQLVQKMEIEQGCNLAEVAIGRMMVAQEEQTGRFPSWDETVPEWILKASGLKSK